MWETRAGSGPPVALIHGLSGSSRWWSRNLDVIAERHTVAAIDLVGFGQNRRFFGTPAVLPPFPEVTALLARWLETFGEPVHLAGHSMGGLIAIQLAAERPDLVRSLTLVNAAGMPFQLDPRPHIRPLPKPPFGGFRIARLLVPDFLRAGPASVAIASTRVVRSDLREMMRAVRVPTLLVWGENDPLVPLQYGRAMQHEIAESRLVVIPRASHVAMWDSADEFNRVFLDFIDNAPQAETAQPVFSWGIAGWTDGIAHRQAGPRRDIVLVHGLGMSSAYLERLAAVLFDGGWNPIAPDLPGFGESANAPAGGPEEHAAQLAKWADAMGIRDAVWLGHSFGCNAVAHLARMRPDLVSKAAFVGPLWTRNRHPMMRMCAMLALDALREPLALYRHVLRAYWRTGIARWVRTAARFAHDFGCDPPAGIFIAGTRDPLPDRTCLNLVEVPGAHACLFSRAGEVGKILRNALFTPAPESLPPSSVLPRSRSGDWS